MSSDRGNEGGNAEEGKPVGVAGQAGGAESGGWEPRMKMCPRPRGARSPPQAGVQGPHFPLPSDHIWTNSHGM